MQIQLQEQSENIFLSLYDLTGKLIDQEIVEPGDADHYFDLAQDIARPAMYILEMKNSSENLLAREKLLVQ